MKNKLLENENVIIWQEEKVQYLQFKKLLEYPEVIHCYTLRSEERLNFMPEDKDAEALENSKKAIATCLNINDKTIVKPHQTHTDRVEVVEKVGQKFDEVDGLITNQKEIALCTTSADCTTLLFYDPVTKVIGNVHSGWKGTVQKIGKKAVQKMIDTYGCKPENTICCICPHIHKCHFEVEEDVRKIFEDTFSDICKKHEIIVTGRVVEGVQKYNIDTTKINIEMLKEIGVKEQNIFESGICTVCKSNDFHSYRTDKEKSGRNAGIIAI